MPRKPRIEVPGGFFHVTSRGCARAPIFGNDATRELHLALLAQTVDEFGWICHAFCQMDNHFHLVLQTPEPTLSAGMQFLNGTYAQTFNRRTGRCGHLFQGRFHAVLIRWDGQLAATERYTVLNRVRCGAVAVAAEWPWSSFGATAGIAPRPAFLTVETTLARFGDPRSPEARSRYRAFVAEGARASSLRAVLTTADRTGRPLADTLASARERSATP